MTGNAQVTEIWTDFNGFWRSSSTSINATQPNTAHHLLAFRWNGSVYSTGVNDQELTSRSVAFSPANFRALPIDEVPLTSTGNAYFVALGALVDGIATTVDNGPTIPFTPLASGAQKATYLTRGIQGLDLGSGLTNIPSVTPIRFNLSNTGITANSIGDGRPDIIFAQIAQATGKSDRLKFVNSNGVTVGNELVVALENNNFPIVGNWNLDLYNNNSTQTNIDFINTIRPIRFLAADLSSFGITPANANQITALLYTPGGDSDPAFVAFNEDAIAIATKLSIISQPTESDCEGKITPIQVRLLDQNNQPILQAGITITTSLETGPGRILGPLTATTDTNGIATFTGLFFEIGGDHVIRFSNSSLEPALTTNILAVVGCPENIWTGNIDTNWYKSGNWATGFIPNLNNNVEIPTGRPNYPVLERNAGAKNLTLGPGASVNINGQTFAIAGTITKDSTAKISASVNNSVLYMAGSSAQTIPSGLILNGNIANLTTENIGGVTNQDDLKLTEVLLVRAGPFSTGNSIDLVCRFEPTRRTAQVGPIGASGSINGDLTVEQCFPARRAFRFITSSVTTNTSIRANWQENATAWNNNPKPGYGTHITGTAAFGSSPSATDGKNGFDWQPSGNPSLFSFNNANQTWSSVPNTDNDNLVAGTPYRLLIRGNRSTDIRFNASPPTNTILRSTGSVVKGPVTVNSLSSTPNAYNLVGNPFHSQVDMSIVRNSASNIKPFIYVYDPTLGGTPVVGQAGGRGGYVSINVLTGVKSIPASDVSIFLQPYQAFYVQTDVLGGAPTITFNENAKATASIQTNVFRNSNDNKMIGDNQEEESVIQNQYIELTLFNKRAFDSNETSSDGLRIDFTANSNNNVDSFDAVKFLNSDENIARKVGTTLISMENRAPVQNGEVLPLNITQYRTTEYTMQIKISAFTNQKVHLNDYFTNQKILLRGNEVTNYSFKVNNAEPMSITPERFAFEFQENTLNAEQPTFNSGFTLYPNPTDGTLLFLNSNKPFEHAEIEIYNLVGQKISALAAAFKNNNQLSIPVTNLPIGIYIINVKTNTGEKFTSKFVRK